jgi:hypothetical protein
MASKKVVTAERAALQAFDKKHEGKELTDAQKKERGTLLTDALAADLNKLGVKKMNTACRALGNLASLSKFRPTSAQVDKMEKTIEAAANAAIGALRGKTTAGGGFKFD